MTTGRISSSMSIGHPDAYAGAVPASPISEPETRLVGDAMDRCRVDVHLNGDSSLAIARQDIRRGLTGHPKSLPPKYFYDSRGSALFECITQLPEYYLTRAEQSIIASIAEDLMEEPRPVEVIELGSGSTAKIHWLLEARSAPDHLVRYVPFDFDQQAVQAAVERLTASYPFLQAYGVVGEFERHVEHLPARIGRRLVVFFGSTIGNLDPQSRHNLLVQVQGQLASGDRFLLGIDLVKERGILEAAYNDSRGVTADFNRNILRVVNRAANADFRAEAFRHHAFYDSGESRIEMHLVPATPQAVSLKDLALNICVSPDESIWTESSHKFTQEGTASMLQAAGLKFERWYTDCDGLFALALASPLTDESTAGIGAVSSEPAGIMTPPLPA